MSERILVVAPAWIGDLVTADVLVQALTATRPGCVIDLLAGAWVLPVASRLQGVNQVMEIPAEHGELRLRSLWRLAKTLRNQGHGEAIILPRSVKSALVPFFARVPKRTGYRGECRYGLLTDVRLGMSTRESLSERYAALAFPKGARLPKDLPRPHLTVDHESKARLIDKFDLGDDSRPVLAIAPGASYGEAKRWPVRSYGQLAAVASAAGWAVWVVGGPGEVGLVEYIKSVAPEARALAGSTSLSEAIDLIAASTVLVSNDSGLMHVAAAVEVPVVAIYGSSSPTYTPPLGKSEVLYLNLECSPCFRRQCPLGHLDCLTKISVDAVWAAVTRLVDGSGLEQ